MSPPQLAAMALSTPVSLEALATAVQPTSPGVDRMLMVPGPLGSLLPGGGVRLGSVVLLDGPLGAGVMSISLQLAAAATAFGGWAAMVDDEETPATPAAVELGVVLERFLVVRHVPVARWATVVAQLSDAVALVVCRVPQGLTLGTARRLVARARRRGTILVVTGAWPGESGLRIKVERSTWRAQVGEPGAPLGDRLVHLVVEGHGRPGAPRSIPLADQRVG